MNDSKINLEIPQALKMSVEYQFTIHMIIVIEHRPFRTKEPQKTKKLLKRALLSLIQLTLSLLNNFYNRY